MDNGSSRILSYLNAQNLPVEDKKLIMADVEATFKEVIVATILENLVPADRKKFITCVEAAAKDPADRQWLDFATSKIPQLDSILDTAFMDAIQRIKLGI